MAIGIELGKNGKLFKYCGVHSERKEYSLMWEL